MYFEVLVWLCRDALHSWSCMWNIYVHEWPTIYYLFHSNSALFVKQCIKVFVCLNMIIDQHWLWIFIMWSLRFEEWLDQVWSKVWRLEDFSCTIKIGNILLNPSSRFYLSTYKIHQTTFSPTLMWHSPKLPPWPHIYVTLFMTNSHNLGVHTLLQQHAFSPWVVDNMSAM